MQDTVDQYLRDRQLAPVMQAVMGGKFAQQIICASVNFRSEKEEEFYQASLHLSPLGATHDEGLSPLAAAYYWAMMMSQLVEQALV